MKMKQILSLFLAVLMLCGCATLFASCAGGDAVKVSGKELTLDLTDFSIYYGEELSENSVFRDMTAELATLVNEKTGKNRSARLFSSAQTTAADPEILIGDTSRAETQEALSAIKGSGFTIRVSENKIVIVGTSKLLTVQALQYFLRNYLRDAEQATALVLPAKISADKVKSVTLATAEGSPMPFVYSQTLSDSNKYTGDKGITNKGFDNRDFPFAAVEGLIEELRQVLCLKSDKGFTKQKDSEPAAGAEFAVGIVERDHVKTALSKLNGAEYCFCVQDGQVIMTAWNDEALEDCYNLVRGLFKEAVVIGEDGTISVAFPEGFELTGSGNVGWVTDFPQPDGLSLYNTLDTADNSLQYLYLGEGVNADAFRAYCEKLKGEGYKLLTENEIEGSLFATYVSEEAGQMIYVAFNAYTHWEKYGHEYEQALRIVVSPTSDVAVPDAALLNPSPSYTKITNSAVTAIALEKGCVGMSYAVTLEDGRLILFDGGAMGESTTVVADLWETLSKLHEQAHGAPPSSTNPIRVAAWVITHSHSDHYNVARNLIKTYGDSGLFKLENLIGNFPSRSATWPIYNSDIGKMTDGGAIEELQRISGCTFLKVHTGQRYYFANLEIEVITTYDDLNPIRAHVQNDTNTVLRFSLKKEGAEDYVMMWLGDANLEQSRFMSAMFGDYVKADMVQVAHHGNTGCDNDLYNSIKASVVLFPNRLSSYQMYLNPDSRKKSRCYDVDQTLIYDNPNTKYVFVSHAFDTTIPFGADNKPMFDKIYDAIGGPTALISYVTDVKNGGTAIKVR